MISEILLVAGIAVLSLALRSFAHPVAFRIGTFGFVATSFLAGWILGGSLLLGTLFASTWFLLPWFEILTRIRRMRLPLHRSLEKCPPPPYSSFPTFGDLTEQMEEAGFEYVEDVDWNHDQSRHFYRLFYNPKLKTTGTICLVEQDQFSFYYSTLSSYSLDGRHFLTWNYPFSPTMHLLPRTVLNRVEDDATVGELIQMHEDFLATNAIDFAHMIEKSTSSLRADAELEMRELLEHNVAKGIFTQDSEQMIRYSLRGMFYLWAQFLREFVRFS